MACGRAETGEVSTQTIARLYRKRWRIEGTFQRLESVLASEIRSFWHPRAALRGFAVAVRSPATSALVGPQAQRGAGASGRRGSGLNTVRFTAVQDRLETSQNLR